MNPDQLIQQIKKKLQEVAWPTGSTEVVFGTDGVAIYSGTPTADDIPAGFPWVLVGLQNWTADPDHPDYGTQTFELHACTDVTGDPLGEFAISRRLDE